MNLKKLLNFLLKGIMIFLIIFLLLAIYAYFFAFSSKDREVFIQKPKSIEINGQKRDYLISKDKNNTPKKILIGLHGFGGGAKTFAYYTALHNSVDKDTLVIYPNAIKPSSKGVRPGWNSGFCCGSGWVEKVDDVAFIEELINKYSKEYNIKNKDIFLVGFSNGAFMAERFATDKPQLIGGVIAASGTIGTTRNSLDPKTPVPILLMHGALDKTVPFNGGAVSSNPDFDWLPFKKTQQTWKNINSSFAPTKTIIYQDKGHSWNGWRLINFWHSKTNASNETVNFINSLN